MVRHHHLPAAFIGGFSPRRLMNPARDRPIVVMRRGSERPFTTRAAKIGFVNDLYTLVEMRDDQHVDNVWSAYEKRLTPAIAGLLDRTRPLDATTWLRILVPFVTSLFVRGPDFDRRFEGLMAMANIKKSNIAADSINGSRLMELQRLLAPVTAARWVVQHRQTGQPFVSNDLGLALTGDPDSEQYGWAIPLSPDAVLSILIQERRAVVMATEQGWVANIEHWDLPSDNQGLNVAMAQAAQSFVFGPTEAAVSAAAAHFPQSPIAPEDLMSRWPFSRQVLAAHEFDWHRLVSIVGKPADQPVDLQAIDFAILAADFVPTIFFPDNLPEFRSGLVARSPVIELELSEQTGFPEGEHSPFEPFWLPDDSAGS